MFSFLTFFCLISWLVCAQALLSRVGPFGGNGGRARNIRVPPHRLESVTICSDDVVNSLAFSYTDCKGQKRSTGPWGSSTSSKVATVRTPSTNFYVHLLAFSYIDP